MDIFAYAYIRDFDTKIELLASLAMPEQWSVPGQSDNSILKSYIKFYFRRIHAESKIKVESRNSKVYSFFNTGLMTNYFQEIYAVFEENVIPGRQRWYFVDFIAENNTTHAALWIREKPTLANFFTRKSDIIFDVEKSIILSDVHIIEENYPRINHGNRSAQEIFTLISGAIEKTRKMIARNYKIAIPQFFKDKNATDGEIQFLIPLYFGDARSTIPDAILTVKEQDGYYQATTCLTKEMAYNNARLIAKPSDEWLNV